MYKNAKSELRFSRNFWKIDKENYFYLKNEIERFENIENKSNKNLQNHKNFPKNPETCLYESGNRGHTRTYDFDN